MTKGGEEMLKKLRQLAEEKGLGKLFQRDNLIILILSGVLLLIIAMPTKSAGTGSDQESATTVKSESSQNSKSGQSSGVTQSSGTQSSESLKSTGTQNEGMSQNSQGNASESDGSGGAEKFWGSLSDYEAAMEARLEQILEGMAGAGKVSVMITFASSQELVVEKDRPLTRSNTTESDSEGGSRNIYQTESGETTVYITQGTDSEPYVVKTLTPKVEGVLIAAEGAGTGEVTKNITEAVQALFDLEAHKIKVVKMEKGE